MDFERKQKLNAIGEYGMGCAKGPQSCIFALLWDVLRCEELPCRQLASPCALLEPFEVARRWPLIRTSSKTTCAYVSAGTPQIEPQIKLMEFIGGSQVVLVVGCW